MQINGFKVLIIGFVWPEPTSTAAGQRMLQLIEQLLKAQYKITFASTAKKTELTFDLSKIRVAEKEITLNSSSFDDFVRELNPDVVFFDRFIIEEQFGWRVEENVPNALRVLNTEDLHSLRNSREKALKQKINFSTDFWKAQDITKREIASILRSDISVIISSHEMHLLEDEIGLDKNLLLFLPFMFSKVDDSPLSFESRKDFVCIGNGKHAPNVDVIVTLKKDIWPIIRKQLPDAQLHIYGAYLPEHVNQMHNVKEGFIIQGWAENDLDVMSKSKVCLAPINYGAGIKGKLFTAMRSGTPSVTTTVGAEGILFGESWSGVITKNTLDFVENAVKLYTDKAEWKQAQKIGFKIINNAYNATDLGSVLLDKIADVRKTLSQHRSTNFIGSVLQHQSMKSTKYMSRWIALKNKK